MASAALVGCTPVVVAVAHAVFRAHDWMLPTSLGDRPASTSLLLGLTWAWLWSGSAILAVTWRRGLLRSAVLAMVLSPIAAVAQLCVSFVAFPFLAALMRLLGW